MLGIFWTPLIVLAQSYSGADHTSHIANVKFDDFDAFLKPKDQANRA
jgi:hypothetical protein